MADNIGDFLRFFTERYDKANPKRVEELIGPLGTQINNLQTVINQKLDSISATQAAIVTAIQGLSGGLTASQEDALLSRLKQTAEQAENISKL